MTTAQRCDSCLEMQTGRDAKINQIRKGQGRIRSLLPLRNNNSDSERCRRKFDIFESRDYFLLLELIPVSL